jgi:uracil-DNA glycosylase
MSEIRLEPSWLKELGEEFQKSYMQDLRGFLKEEKSKGEKIVPPGDSIFKAFFLTPFDQVKVVLLGQDPYHGPGQAQGISFSVPRDFPVPPSLVNIFKELKSDLDIPIPNHGDLSSWAAQGVLLLNASLTVRLHSPGSHQGKGWEIFTHKAIEILSQKRDHLVFILWGNYAQSKMEIIDPSRHLILASSHPSPFSAHKGFLGSKPFSKSNQYLEANGILPIDWNLGSTS